jgi:hypothetical protein
MTVSVLRHPFLFASQGTEPKGVPFNTCLTHVKSVDETTSVISSQLEKPSKCSKVKATNSSSSWLETKWKKEKAPDLTNF